MRTRLSLQELSRLEGERVPLPQLQDFVVWISEDVDLMQEKALSILSFPRRNKISNTECPHRPKKQRQSIKSVTYLREFVPRDNVCPNSKNQHDRHHQGRKSTLEIRQAVSLWMYTAINSHTRPLSCSCVSEISPWQRQRSFSKSHTKQRVWCHFQLKAFNKSQWTVTIPQKLYKFRNLDAYDVLGSSNRWPDKQLFEHDAELSKSATVWD